MLRVVDPTAERARVQHEHALNDHDLLETFDPGGKPDAQQNCRHGGVGPPYRAPFPLPGTRHAPGQAVHDQELQHGQDAEKYDGVANQAVRQLAPPPPLPVFGHRERDHVTGRAPVQVACVTVVPSVNRDRVVVGREARHREHAADGVGHLRRREVGAVTAIMLNDDQTCHQARGRQGDDGSQPVADFHAPEKCGPRGAVTTPA